jgi:hypothetical protein
MTDERARNFETFVTWYLRFNGYFTVPNFVVHAGDDPGRINKDVIGNYTEVDTIAVRLPHSREESGTEFPTDGRLIAGAEGKFDVIFAEVKSGESNTPNSTWHHKEKVHHIEYMLKFLGWHRENEKIKQVADVLQKTYLFEEVNLRLRYVIFSESANPTWVSRGVSYITFDDCIRFIVNDRGQCWAQAAVGRRSIHDQWSDLIKRVLEVANRPDLDPQRRQTEVRAILGGSAK